MGGAWREGHFDSLFRVPAKKFWKISGGIASCVFSRVRSGSEQGVNLTLHAPQLDIFCVTLFSFQLILRNIVVVGKEPVSVGFLHQSDDSTEEGFRHTCETAQN